MKYSFLVMIMIMKTKINNKSVGLSDSQSKEECLTLEEYYLECARFGELTELKEAMKDAPKDFNVNLEDFSGNTALHLASANGFIEVVKYLVNELHCDVNAKNKSLSTPLSWAAFNGQKKSCGIFTGKKRRRF